MLFRSTLAVETQIPTSLFQSTIQQQANYLYLQSRHNPISGLSPITGMRLVQPQHTDSSPAGSYIINSEISPFAWSSKECQRVPLSKKNSKFFKRAHTSNARFETRHGAITLNLATAGTDDTKLTRTYVQASSWHAKININLVGCQL